ncbi:hypothetical protein ACFLZQ_01620 [Thermodesulfobacteriota bacterium]
MARKQRNTIDQIFSKDDKRSTPGEISWLLDVGQTDMRGLSGEQQADFLYKKIYEGRRKGDRPTPQDVMIDFYSPLVDGSARLKSYLPVFNFSADKKRIEKNVSDFLVGLSGFIIILKAALNAPESADLQQLFSDSFPASFHLDLQAGTMRMVHEWTSYKEFGPYALSALFSGYPVKALRLCPHCKRMFFTLYPRKKCCSDECTQAKGAFKTDKDRILDQLKSRKSHLAIKRGMQKNSEIAQHLEDVGFIQTMRDSGFFEDEEISRLIPRSGKYGIGRASNYKRRG